MAFYPIHSEAYGLCLRAENLADPRVVHLCEIVQGGKFRERLRGLHGYGVERTGDLRLV